MKMKLLMTALVLLTAGCGGPSGEEQAINRQRVERVQEKAIKRTETFRIVGESRVDERTGTYTIDVVYHKKKEKVGDKEKLSVLSSDAKLIVEASPEIRSKLIPETNEEYRLTYLQLNEGLYVLYAFEDYQLSDRKLRAIIREQYDL